MIACSPTTNWKASERGSLQELWTCHDRGPPSHIADESRQSIKIEHFRLLLLHLGKDLLQTTQSFVYLLRSHQTCLLRVDVPLPLVRSGGYLWCLVRTRSFVQSTSQHIYQIDYVVDEAGVNLSRLHYCHLAVLLQAVALQLMMLYQEQVIITLEPLKLQEGLV